MPLVGPLTPPSSDESEAGGGGGSRTVLDPLNFVQVLIPVRFPADLSINLNCVSLLSSSSSQSSPGSSFSPSVSTPRSIAPSYSSPLSSASSHNEESSIRSTFEPIDEVSEEFGEDEIERILRDNKSDTNSYQDDYTECDLDLEDVDLDEFPDGSGQVTSTTRNRGHDNSPLQGQDTDDEEEDEEESVVENPNPVPCGHCQGGKDHSASGDLIWPIQLDFDLIKTLLHLCPDFFEDFDEVEMDPMEFTFSQDLSSISSSQDTQPSSTTATTTFSTNQSDSSQPSPPNVQVDDSPLQPCMVRNKESLKVKLLLRRPMTQLIEQGILPPSKTPPAFAEQRVRLERARMGDLLKAKIQQRPARQELIRQHILEESDARVAPSLAEKQRMLKRARLADSLNDHLIHRPGPLELVKKNILHAPDAIIDQAIKEGVVEFKATSEGLIPGPHVPSNIYLSEDDSSSDLSSPAGTPDQSQSSSSSSEPTQQQKGGTLVDLLPVAQSPTSTVQSQSSPNAAQIPSSPRPQFFIPTAFQSPTSSTVSSVQQLSDSTVPQPPPLPQTLFPITHIPNELLSKIVKAAVSSSTTPPITSAQLTLSKLSTLEHQQLLSAVQQNQPSPRTLTSQTNFTQGTPNAFSQQHASTGKARTAKKSTPKIKATPKARQIKFHEYKGPPSAQKGQMQPPQNEVESSYELLLQQQQLFLQWQLEYRHKYPQIILPAVSKLASPTEVAATFASAVNAVNAGAATMVPGSIVTATSSSPHVRSPSTISSVMNSNNTGTSGQQPIAPAPPPPITVQALVEKYNKNAATVTGTLPLKITVPQGSNSTLTDIRPKLTPSRSIDMNSSSASVSSSPKSTSHLDISKLNDWKVSDLKAELKKRNLPVSGAKPQLIERLKMADVSLQDESISSSSNGNTTPGKLLIKPEGHGSEESCSSELMDMSEGGALLNFQNTQMTDLQDPTGKSNNLAAMNAARLTLLQNNNLQNNGAIPVHILNALSNVAKNANLKTGMNGKSTQNIVVVDEKLIREQQIEQLEQALKTPQPQNSIKISAQQTPGTGQKHRIALQQHLQHKMQQQAVQSQLQKLIQLHALQQQQQQAQKVAAQKPMAAKLNLQQAQIQILSPKNLQKASSSLPETTNSESRDSTLTLHQSDEGRNEIPTSSATALDGLNNVPIVSSGNEHLTLPNNNHVSHQPQINVPFRILHIETSTDSSPQELHQLVSEEGDFSNIPQLQIREIKTPAFHAGESDSSQSTKSGSFSTDAGDPMDHSWLLKINENPPTSPISNTDTTEEQPEPKKSVVKEFANFFESFANGDQKKEELKLQIPKPRRGFKSQMVDDVLEILIRNGELPPSAAQDPSTPTPGKSPDVLAYQQQPSMPSSIIPSTVNEGSKLGLSNSTTPPTPPPLPPPTFAVTLPTSITFSRSPTANPLLSPFQNHHQTTTTDISVKGPPPPYPADSLSKEAQDIFKISQDLSNFGKAHDQTESERLFSGVNQLQPQTTEILGNLDYDSNSFAMLLDEVEKDAMSNLEMDMDNGEIQNQEISRINFQHSAGGDQEMCEESNVRVKQEDLLDELGTLLPPDLDVSMPMEMDYSDWLDQLLPENQTGSTPNFQPPPSSNNNMALNNNFFMDYHNNSAQSFGNRDPLLSSSFNIFPSETPNGVELKNNRGGTSPMAMGDNLLWEFF